MEINNSEVNKEKRKERHFKLFFPNENVRWNKLKTFLLYLRNFKSIITYLSFHKKTLILVGEDQALDMPQRFLLRKSAVLILFFLIIGSLNIDTAFTYNQEDQNGYWGFADNTLPIDMPAFVNDDEGYLAKSVPSINESATYLNREETVIVHEVQEKQTLSQIAEMYGLKMQTIVWANDIKNSNNLQVGTKLKIPNEDGVIYTVKDGDSLNKIAKDYNVDIKLIMEKNKMTSDVIQAGKAIVIPGGRPIVIIKKAPVYIATTKKGASSSGKGVVIPKSGAKIASNGRMTFPTIGGITQGYKSYHLAIDIADRSMPAVWAARGGTVIKAMHEGYNGGYGRHLIIDHGNGVQTLYAHLNKVYVTVGQYVNEGQVVGQMGNTGRVYGVTGIHLHFEVRVNGVKVSPWNYLK